MTGLELLTAKNYGVTPLVLILRDGELSQISQFQKNSVVRTHLTEVHAYQSEQLAKAVGYEYVSLPASGSLEDFFRGIYQRLQEGAALLVEVPIDYSNKTAFTQGVVLTNFKRFPIGDKLSLVGRVLARKTSQFIQNKWGNPT
jgi:acetolactate synthase-1/2/3 large subunit